ncbi:hypothetical protein Ahy_B03g062466 isoform B [Arachis hypogaea]|uniref:Transmembrane protein n=1 Tax=Arachis hypogaea TaxID=3818 RepID=A0A444ZUC5_ARAHY|nr:hypothetical protein Ahy_B03g062466 isoform B [Arachis hypogaea]
MEEEKGKEKEMGLGVHSQVIKIKKETEKIKHPSLRRVNSRDVNRLRSRSPLGLAHPARPFLLDDDFLSYEFIGVASVMLLFCFCFYSASASILGWFWRRRGKGIFVQRTSLKQTETFGNIL